MSLRLAHLSRRSNSVNLALDQAKTDDQLAIANVNVAVFETRSLPPLHSILPSWLTASPASDPSTSRIPCAPFSASELHVFASYFTKGSLLNTERTVPDLPR